MDSPQGLFLFIRKESFSKGPKWISPYVSLARIGSEVHIYVKGGWVSEDLSFHFLPSQ